MARFLLPVHAQPRGADCWLWTGGEETILDYQEQLGQRMGYVYVVHKSVFNRDLIKINPNLELNVCR
jgi:hypothetical protein